MIQPGLVSITFRKLAPREIVDLVRRGGLTGIEWGGDVHAPHGQADVAATVAAMTADAGLQVAAYGSYYRAGVSEADGLAFGRVLDTAAVLGAPTVRVWAGNRGSAEADAPARAAVVEDARRIAGLAQAAGMTVSFEYHRGTLTDTNASAQALLQEIAHPNIRTYWQPPVGTSPEYCLKGLAAVLPHLTNIHVFHWLADAAGHDVDRRALAEGRAVWSQYLTQVAATKRDHFALIEFVRGETPEQFLADAATLKGWVAGTATADR
jgi:sugar phosphate isomerase/epimerase